MNEQLASILDSISDGLFTLNADLVVTYFNKAAERFLGRQAAEVEGRNLFDAFPEAKGSIFEEQYTHAIVNKVFVSFETYFGVTPYENWYHVRVHPTEEGIAVYFQVTTALRSALSALEDRERHYRLLFEMASDFVFLHELTTDDRRGRFIDANAVVCKLLGYSKEELLQLSPLDIMGGDDLLAAYQGGEELFAGNWLLFEQQLTAKNGDSIPVEIHARLFELDGKCAVISVARDIRKRKQMEDQLRVALRERETLLKEVHHRIKNNFQLISSLLQYQAMTVQNAQARKSLELSDQRIRAMALVHEKLYQTSNLAQIDLGSYVTDLAGDLFRAYGTSYSEAVSLQLDIRAVIQIDLERAMACGLILNELIANALQHAFPDAVDPQDLKDRRIFVSLAPGCQDKCVLVVADNGIGLSPESRRRDTLGLMLVEQLAEQLQGIVEWQTSPGGGLTCRIEFA